MAKMDVLLAALISLLNWEIIDIVVYFVSENPETHLTHEN